MKIGDIIKDYRAANQLSMQEFAAKAGLSKGYISMLEKGRHPQNDKEIIPSIDTVSKLASAMGITIDELLSRTGANQQIELSSLPPNIITPSAYPVPILGTSCAGDGIVMEESYKGTFYVDKSIKADYCLFVKGDSMTGANIYDGDVAFLIKEYDFVDGEIYAVQFGTCGDASLKRVTRSTGKLILQPCNPDYQPVIEDPADVYIVGKLVGHYHEDQI